MSVEEAEALWREAVLAVRAARAVEKAATPGPAKSRAAANARQAERVASQAMKRYEKLKRKP